MRRSRLLPLAAALVLLLLAFGVGGLADRATGDSVSVAAPLDRHARVFAPSMRGTLPDGRLTVHRDRLVPTPELVYLFEYYLAAQGERSLPEIVSAIGDDLRSRLSLSPAALAQAERLLERYLAYRTSLLALDQGASGSPGGGLPVYARLQERLQRQRRLREQFFSAAEVSALFAMDDLRDTDTVSRLEIFENARLSPSERQAAYAQLDLGLPALLKEERDAPLRIQNLERQVAQMRDAGASEREVEHFRAIQFSPEAARRLQLVDQERQSWANRIQQYQAEVRQLLQLTEGPLRIPETLPPVQQAALDALRNQHFTPQEQRRLAAYEVRG